MEYNKIIYNGETLIDLSNDTVNKENLKKGIIAHNSAGKQIIGELSVDEPYQWIRPDDMPNLDAINIDDYEDCILLTVDVTDFPFLSFKANTNSGSGQIILWEQGYIDNDEFICVNTFKATKNSSLKQWITPCVENERFNVFRITAPGYKIIACGLDTGPQVESQTAPPALCNPIYEIRAKLTNATNVTNNKLSTYYVEHIKYENLSLQTSMASLCQNCVNVKQIDFVNCNTSKCTTFQSLFNACYNLQRITGIENWDTSKSTNFSSCFINCLALKENAFDTSNWDTRNATTMASMYSYMNSIKRFKIRHSTAKCTNISNMFSNCMTLEYLDAKGFAGKAVQNMQAFVQTCRNLVRIDVSEWDTTGVTNATSVFQNDYSLKELDCSDWDLDTNQSIATVWGSMNSLCNLKIPENMHLGFTYNSAPATKESLMDLAVRVGVANGSQTLTLGNNKYKLTSEEKALITEKGWTIA